MTDGQQLAAAAVQPAGTSVTDRAGSPLFSCSDPGLATVANLLTQAPNHKGNPGLPSSSKTPRVAPYRAARRPSSRRQPTGSPRQ